MKKLVAAILLITFACFTHTGIKLANAQAIEIPAEDPKNQPGYFQSKTLAYSVVFPVPAGSETGKAYKSLSGEKKLISYVTAEHKSEELGQSVKYTLDIRPIEQFRPPADEIEENINDLINFYEENYNYQVLNIKEYDEQERMGTDIVIEFFNKDLNPAELTAQDKVWAIRRLVFHYAGHIFLLEAFGSQDYVHSRKTDNFFESLETTKFFAPPRQ